MNEEKIFRAGQNADGGWAFRAGGSWTEPTVYALLAQRTGQLDVPGAARAVKWLRSAQRSDGGFPPRPNVAQSTWVTALVALLPPETIGPRAYRRAVGWLLERTGMESTVTYRLREFLRSGRLPEGGELVGWPWFPGNAAWVTPTCLGVLALEKCCRHCPSSELNERIAAGRAWLLSRRCADGGWNHGSERVLGYDADAYPETTGQALLALRGVHPEVMEPSLTLARRMLPGCHSAAGAAWLRLGLLAHEQRPSDAPAFDLPCRTLPDVALQAIARAAGEGRNALLD
jgi:Prenyltransferase and squalene oxidase repeat